MLVSCHACGKRISDRAPQCPFCGATPRPDGLPSGMPAMPAQPSVALSSDAPAGASIGAPPAPRAPAPPVAPLPAYQRGDFIGDKLQVVRVLGEGGFGIVYEVVSQDGGYVYALKTLRSEMLREEAALDLFRKEVQIWIDLGAHPHLVRAYWVDEIAGRLWMAMERIEPDPMTGLNSLDGYLSRRPPSYVEALTWAVQFCHGMEYARSRGVRCHRDIKPANILIGRDRSVRISDFGIAGVTAVTPAGHGVTAPGQTMAGAVFGTPTHMSPEQFESAARCDVRSDVYSFGVVLHQMLARGALPFVPPPPPPGIAPDLYYFEAFRQMHAETEPSGVDSPAAGVVARCLQKDPAQRFQDFAALRAELDALLIRETGHSVTPVQRKATDAWELANKGNSLGALGRHEEALVCYDQALRLDSGIAAIHNNRGNALRQLGRQEEAHAAFDRALELDPRYVHALVNKGLACAEEEKNEEALSWLERGLALDARDTNAWVTRGVVLGRLGRIEEELGCLERALEIDPRDETAWLNKGLTLSAHGRREEAIAAFDRCLECNPRNAKAWTAKGVDLGEIGRTDDAIACLDEGLRQAPDEPMLWYNKGNALVQTGRLAEAHACFGQTTRLAPRFPVAWYNKALCEIQLNRPAEGLSSLREYLRRADTADPLRRPAENLAAALARGETVALRLGPVGDRVDSQGRTKPVQVAVPASPSPPPVAAPPVEALAPPAPAPVHEIVIDSRDPQGGIKMLRALSLGLLQSPTQKEQAEQPLRMWAQADPASAEPHAALGELLTGLGRLEEALAEFDRAAALEPRVAGHLCNRGHLLEALGRREEALAALDAALALDPELSRSWANRANTLNSLGRFQEALADSDKALALGLDEAGLYYNRGLSLRGLERWSDAVAAFDVALARDAGMASCWYFRGEALAKLSQWEASVQSFEKMLEIEKRNERARAMAFYHRGRGLQTLGRVTAAADSFRAALAINPEYEEALGALAALPPSADGPPAVQPLSKAAEWNVTAAKLFGARRFAEALDCSERALAIDPTNDTALNNRANSLFQLGQREEALVALERAIESSPLFIGAWFNRAVILNMMGRKAESLRIMEDIPTVAESDSEYVGKARSAAAELRSAGIAPAPRDALGLMSQGFKAAAAGAWARAIASLDQAVALEPKRGALWRWKGDAHKEARQLEDALQSYTQALLLDPRDADAHHSFGRVLAQLHRPQEALAAYDRAIAANPQHVASWSDRGKMLGVLKRHTEAIASLQRATELAPEAYAPWQNKALVEDEIGREADALESFRRFLERATPDLRLQIEQAKARISVLEGRLRGNTPAAPPPAPRVTLPPAPATSAPTPRVPSPGSPQPSAQAPPRPKRPPHPAALDRSRRAMEARRAGRLEEALGLYQKALELERSSGAIWTEYGESLVAAGKRAEAMAAFEQAIAADPQAAAPLTRKGELLGQMGESQAALECFAKAVNVDPLHVPAWVACGALLVDVQQTAEALEMLTHALSLDAKSAEAWHQYGRALLGNADVPKAAEAFGRAVDIDPNRPATWLHLARLLVAAERPAELLAVCDRAARYVRDPQLRFFKGLALQALGRVTEALSCYEAVTAADPGNVAAWNARAVILEQADQVAPAMQCFEHVLAATPTYAPALYGRAACLDRLGQKEEALGVFREYLKHADGEPPARVEMARRRVEGTVPVSASARPAPASVPPGPAIATSIPDAPVPRTVASKSFDECLKNGEISLGQKLYPRALEWIDQAIAADPRKAQPWELKGDALMGLHRPLDAASHYRRAVAINPKGVLTWQKYATALDDLGRHEEALQAWEKGIEANAQNAAVRNGRGQCLFRLARYEDALQSFEEAILVDGRYAMPRLGKAQALRKLGRNDDAVRSYQQFLSLAPPHLESEIDDARSSLMELGVL